MRTGTGAQSEASVARGMAVLAVASAVIVGVLMPSSDLRGELLASEEAREPSCAAPVALATPSGDLLACASDPELSGCAGLGAGDRVRVRGGGCELQPGGMAPETRLLYGLKLDLNRATAEELELLSGIGPKRARAIVAERERNGPFASVDDLLRVRGIGDATLSLLRPYLEVRP